MKYPRRAFVRKPREPSPKGVPPAPRKRHRRETSTHFGRHRRCGAGARRLRRRARRGAHDRRDAAPNPATDYQPGGNANLRPGSISITGASSTPLPIPSGFGLPGNHSPKPGEATPSPPPNPRKGIEGVWEMVIQRSDQPEYVHFVLKQTGTTLAGVYRDKAGQTFPLAGSVDGQHFRMIVTLPDGQSELLEGRLDGTSDMVGKLTSPKEEAYFTASWRPKEKWIDNVNAGPGGLGTGAGGAGGYPGSPP